LTAADDLSYSGELERASGADPPTQAKKSLEVAMLLGQSQQSTDYSGSLIFLREPAWSETMIRRHSGVPVFVSEPQTSAMPLQEGREPAISLREHPELLRLLGDERFRQELKAKPVEVLKKFGVRLEGDEVPQTVELPMPPKLSDIIWAGLF
jgi:hypothetical protein